MEDRIKKGNKKTSFISALILALFVVTTGFAESPSDSEDTKFHRFWPDNLYAVEFVNDQLGFVAGYGGSLFRTQDGGNSWDGIYIGVNELIRHVSFVDDQKGWAVGHRGSILHTADGGTTWLVQHTDQGNYLRDIAFADANNGWAVGHGGKIWHTSNGGSTWQEQQLTGFTGRDIPRLHGVIAKDANNAILVGEFGVVAHTENAGALWSTSYNKDAATLLSVASVEGGAVAVGLDGGIYNIQLATEDQREEVRVIRAAAKAKKEERARKKAERRGRVYVPKVVEPTPEAAIDYYVSKINSGTKEHLYDVSSTPTGGVVAAGVSSVLKVSGVEVTPLVPAKDFPLPFVWVGGVDVTASGDIWGAGLLGMVVKGNVADMSFDTKLNIAAPGAVKLISSRWGEE